VKNLSIDSASPEGVIVWKGEEGETATVSVTLDDNDVNDPVTLTLKLWPTDMPKLYPSTPDCYDSIVLEDVSGASHTFTWDGNGGMAPPGTYTYDVEAVQTDICNTDPDIRTTDTAKYRSQHLSIWRAFDDNGTPVYDADYLGRDDNGTTAEEDDDYVYYIRKYLVTDDQQKPASEGKIWLYDDTLTKVWESSIAGMDCLLHGAQDGLHPGQHAILIRVPVGCMPYAGQYRFVLHFKDDHGADYRNGQNRWALDLNCKHKVHSFTVWLRSTKPEAVFYGTDVAKRLTNLDGYIGIKGRYAAFPPAGKPARGGTGLMEDKQPVHTIHTLNFSTLANRKYPRCSAVWMYSGHGFFETYTFDTYLAFDDLPYPESGIYSGTENSADQQFMIAGHDLGHIRLAYLMACFSAGANGGLYMDTHMYIPENQSIGYYFKECGARAVIGFKNVLYAVEPYKAFHDTFWTHVCKGTSVGTAFDKALEKANSANDDLEEKDKGASVVPVFFGDRSIKIVPPPVRI